MTQKKIDKEEKNLRSSILDEISRYKFSSADNKKVKRFVWDDPTKSKPATSAEPKTENKLLPTASQAAGLESAMASEAKKSTKQSRSRKIITGTAIGVGALVFFIIVFYQARLYMSIPALARALPWPAAYVNGNFLPLADYLGDMNTLIGFYRRAQETSNTEANLDLAQIETAVADRMVAEAIVLDFANRNGITVSQQMVDDEEAQIVQDFGSVAELETFIKQNYNWNLDQFKDKVIGPYLRRQQIEAWFQQNTSAQEAAVDSINKIYNEIKNGLAFEGAAKKYSQDETNALYDGYLGVFEKGVMVPEFEQALLALDLGEISPPVQTIFGWHIIKRESLPTDQEYKESDLAASHILIKVFDFDKWLQEEKGKSKVWMFLKLPKVKN